MAEDFSDDVRVVNEGDDLHFSAAFRAKEWIDFVDFAEHRGPPKSCGSRWAVRGGGRCYGRRRIGLGLTPPRLVRVTSVVPNQMLPLVRNMLCHLCEKVERVKYLKIACQGAFGRKCAPLGKWKGVVMIGAIEDFALRRHFDHPGLGEWATGDVLGELGETCGVAGFQAHILMHTESRVIPSAHILGHFRRDASLIDQHLEDVVFPHLEERLGWGLGQWDEPTVGRERSIGDDRVDVRMKLDERSERLDGHDGPGGNLIPQDKRIDISNGAPCAPGEFSEEFAVVSEVESEAFRDRPVSETPAPGAPEALIREDELAVGNGGEDVLREVVGQIQRLLLVT